MIEPISLIPEKLVFLGAIEITDTVIITWMTIAVLILLSLYLRSKLSLFNPGSLQLILEALVEGAETISRETFKGDIWLIISFIVTLWLFIGACNLIGLLPGLHPPTSDLNTTLAFAIAAFLMRHYIGMKIKGPKSYLSHFLRPSFLLFPLHLLAEFTRTFALALRLFGNILSGEVVALIVFGLVGLFLPIPFLLLHLILGLLQAYIFGLLSVAFLSQTMENNQIKGEE